MESEENPLTKKIYADKLINKDLYEIVSKFIKKEELPDGFHKIKYEDGPKFWGNFVNHQENGIGIYIYDKRNNKL